MHAAAAKPGRFTGCIKSRNGLTIRPQNTGGEIRVQPAQGFASENIQANGNQRSCFWVENPMGLAVRISMSPR